MKKKELSMKVFWEVLKEDYFIDLGYHKLYKKGNTFCFTINYIAGFLWQQILIKWCQVFGHDIVDEGYANPESGCIDLVCQRCGWSEKTILY